MNAANKQTIRIWAGTVLLSAGAALATPPWAVGDAVSAAAIRVPSPVAAPGSAADGLQTVSREQWGETEVRRVLQAFAYGGQATDAQIRTWAAMSPVAAVAQMLHFEPVNLRLSPQGRGDSPGRFCDSLESLQDLWSSDDPANPMRVVNRPWYATLDTERDAASPLHLFLAWSRLAHTPGCNAFVHKMALYITNYHAAIHIQNTAPTLIRSYYDDVVQALAAGADFVELMTLAATHAAVARAYGHMRNRFNSSREFEGNDDFAREYFQLLFGIEGHTEEEDYHENVTIEHNAWLLTGMALDAVPFAWGSSRRLDWLVAPIVFQDHYDPAGRWLRNRSAHYDARSGDASCLEILHRPVCGRNARDKLIALGPVAAAHAESMAATPLKIIRFFGDDRLDADEISTLQAAWADANYALLDFVRAYAVSTMFHHPGTYKLRSAFDRNLLIHNANQLTSEEAYAEAVPEGPAVRMFEQGALVFAPVRGVFGGQTGADAASDRYVLKKAWDANVTQPAFLARSSGFYRLASGGEVLEWRKDWGAVAPANAHGEYVVSQVGEWLWNRFVNDGGRHFDPVARAQVNALLATGLDFGALADRGNMEAVYSSAEIESGKLAELNAALSAMTMDFSALEANRRVGMAVNFITALPYTFAMEVE